MPHTTSKRRGHCGASNRIKSSDVGFLTAEGLRLSMVVFNVSHCKLPAVGAQVGRLRQNANEAGVIAQN